MRDHRKLEAFNLADQLTIAVYKSTRSFPAGERFGLTNQIRRAAVSIGANIVEGSARLSEADYIRFLNIAYASACELEYELSIAARLGYLTTDEAAQLSPLAARTCKTLRGLVAALTRTA
jgi:four helix bundle protein